MYYLCSKQGSSVLLIWNSITGISIEICKVAKRDGSEELGKMGLKKSDGSAYIFAFILHRMGGNDLMLKYSLQLRVIKKGTLT